MNTRLWCSVDVATTTIVWMDATLLVGLVAPGWWRGWKRRSASSSRQREREVRGRAASAAASLHAEATERRIWKLGSMMTRPPMWRQRIGEDVDRASVSLHGSRRAPPTTNAA
uniref:Uncharacterized protein n=1 Tax=Oryza sativa subsp. japonica TaxID=39947 RepID=Q6ERG9_ORYSJ|nr:hypothetical protein [Oryza sativa Japonica Group]